MRPGQSKLSLVTVVDWVRGTLARQKAPIRVFWVGPGEAIPEFVVTGTGKIRKDVLQNIGNKLIEEDTRSLRTSKL